MLSPFFILFSISAGMARPYSPSTIWWCFGFLSDTAIERVLLISMLAEVSPGLCMKEAVPTNEFIILVWVDRKMDCCNFCNSCWITIRTDSFVDQVCFQRFVDFFRIWISAGVAVLTPVITNCPCRWWKKGISPFIYCGNTFGADHSKDCGLQKMTAVCHPPSVAYTPTQPTCKFPWCTPTIMSFASMHRTDRGKQSACPPWAGSPAPWSWRSCSSIICLCSFIWSNRFSISCFKQSIFWFCSVIIANADLRKGALAEGVFVIETSVGNGRLQY